MKKKIFAFCFGAALFLLSGCGGLNKNTGPVENKKTDARQKVQTIAKQPVDQKYAKVATSLEEAPEPLPPDEIKPLENTPPAKKTVGEPSNNSRFEKAKKELDSFKGAPSKKEAPKAGGVTFNFDNADLYEVVRTMADILNISYIVEPGISGKVTIHTAGEIDRSELFPLFFQVLELNGLSASKEGDLYRILKTDKIITTPVLTRYGRDMGEVYDRERMVMQIVPLQYVAADAIIPTLVPFLSDSGKIIPKPGSDLFIVIDKSNNLERILQLVDVFDVDLFDHISHRFFRLHHTDTKEAMSLVKDLIEPYLKIDRADFKMISVQRLNTLVAISKNERILDQIEFFIKKIDVQENSADPKIFIYKVRNSNAADLSTLLNQVFGTQDLKPSVKPKENAKKESEAFYMFQADKAKAKTDRSTDKSTDKSTEKSEQSLSVVAENTSTAGAGGNSLNRAIRIIPDTIRNALIIEALPLDYAIVKKILEDLDILPRQVLIDVLILDVNISDSRELGVEWSFLKDRPSGDKGLLKADFGYKTGGLTFTAGLTNDWIAAVKALASEGRADVLSAPSVLASDNKPATINVVTQIPVATSTTELGTVTAATTTTVQYRDTGIILSVTPHINDDGMVSMDISQEVSSVVDGGSDVKGAPKFFNRNVKTSLSVKDQQTLVIGGLISQTKNDSSSGVPWLSSLPGIGFLFGNKKDGVVKNELIIMITPRVMNTLNDIDTVSKEFRSKFSDFKFDQKMEIEPVSD